MNIIEEAQTHEILRYLDDQGHAVLGYTAKGATVLELVEEPEEVGTLLNHYLDSRAKVIPAPELAAVYVLWS